jgi:hypothetical protein
LVSVAVKITRVMKTHMTTALEVPNMTKGLYYITSGEAFEVRANSEDEALAIFHVSQGHMDIDDYPQFDITEADLDTVEHIEANTTAEFVLE